LLALQLRTLDASIYNLFDAASIARQWKVSSGSASLVASGNATAAAPNSKPKYFDLILAPPVQQMTLIY
jgi:hypothetical protein